MVIEQYDQTDSQSIETYGKGMIGKTFHDLYNAALNQGILREASAEYSTKHASKNYKGGMGNIVEECYFGYAANSDSAADFADAGVELKVTPYQQNKNGYKAKERLVLTMINYMDIVKERDFNHSHVWKKAKLMLLVWYLHIKGQNDINSTIDYVQLFTPPAEDLEIIRADYAKILSKIRAGKAHELSESDTLYLGACTKASSSKVRRDQPFSDEPAKPRAFSLKGCYMTYVLNNYIMPHKATYELIMRAGEPVTNFEQYVVSKIDAFKGSTVEELCKRFEIKNKSKSIPSMLAFRILGLKGNHAAEFEKAGIVMKAIRIGSNGKIKENISFPAFKYQDLAEETWKNSTFGNYLQETRFFFVIYKADAEGNFHLAGCQFWNMPTQDIEGDVREVWQETHDIVKNGRIQIVIDSNGRATNNFPKQSQHPISHVRPHALTKQDRYPLPVGTKLNIVAEGFIGWDDPNTYPKHCFWLNNSYIYNQLNQKFKS
ncbi:Sau3AI family type II restriction endonuclease [Pectinatus brassicae]|uniref:DNA mismatch repair protein MutH n=1 Tax=Pectinatus brassicae TaxID=862415 RepID=A0A840UM61_9FIRM|nr:Sau3AI family type II restriction endonuclease [Pectinatus brassicae]MBB5335342.1 DNA mismatch repair protein MutH [Pectinatus brassicae]